MDAQAMQDLHTALQAKGYTGTTEEVSQLLDSAREESEMRRILYWWKTIGGKVHHDALAKVYAHARRRGRSLRATLESHDRVTLILSRPRGPSRPSFLGRVDVDGKEIVWSFYTGSDVVRQRSKPALLKPR